MTRPSKPKDDITLEITVIIAILIPPIHTLLPPNIETKIPAIIEAYIPFSGATDAPIASDSDIGRDVSATKTPATMSRKN